MRKDQPKAHWNTNQPGKHPVCVVGAGFQFVVLQRCMPTTETIISQTVRDLPGSFPALKALGPLLKNKNLNHVWTNINKIAEYGSILMPKILTAYHTRFRGKAMGYLVEHLEKQPKASSPSWLLWILLGVELKRMLAFQYNHKRIKLLGSLSPELLGFLAKTKSTPITWISLNYDVCLEMTLGEGQWRYAFDQFIADSHKAAVNNQRHTIIKPHGSLNIWFKTWWESRSNPNKRDCHELFFVDCKDKLKTCDFAEIGCIENADPAEEVRPWVIGYLPDFMKTEINSPGNFADSAHDLCKWNMTYATLALQKASSLYILAYSMPEEDRWIWERLRALPKKDFPIYVASKTDTKRIVKTLKKYGFGYATELTDNGFI